MKLDHMMMKLDQPGNFENTMMMKGEQIPTNPNFDTSSNMNMMKGDPMVNFENPNQMMNNVMKQVLYFLFQSHTFIYRRKKNVVVELTI